MFLSALGWALTLSNVTTPFGTNEEHFEIGRRLYRTGSLGAPDDPGVLRPPGYPFFVAATLHARQALSPLLGPPRRQPGQNEQVLLAAQCVLLALGAVAIFGFSLLVLRARDAAIVALVFACGPLALSLVGVHSYYLLHIVVVAVATGQLAFAATRPPSADRWPSFLAGLLWGLATLVRPVTLILPGFVLAQSRAIRGASARSAAVFTLLFTAGLAATVFPYTVRNYFVSGRLVPVNSQGWFALWATSERTLRADEDFLSWYSLWWETGISIYRQVTGEREYRIEVFNARIFELEAAFKRQALANLSNRPGVYLQNVLTNLWRFAEDPMTTWPGQFARRNRLSQVRAVRLAGAHGTVLLLLAVPGLAVGCFRRSGRAWALLAVFAALAVAHAMTFLTGRYTCAKLPLLVMGLALSIGLVGERSFRVGGLRVRWATALGLGALALSIGTTLGLIWN